MSVVTDVRTRAEDALGQGKQVLDSAQTRLAVTVEDANKFAEQLQGNARELAVRVRGNVTELAEKATSRDVTVAGKSVSIDALTTDVEELVKRYRSTATERAESIVNELKNDERLSKLVERAESIVNDVKSDKRVSQLAERVESVYDALIDAVQDLVVKPVQDLVVKPVQGLIAKSPLANNSKVKTPAVPAPADETAPITPAAHPSA